MTSNSQPFFGDQQYQLKEQYHNASNLTARIDLHRRFSTSPLSVSRWIFAQFSIPPVSRILELGCGTGEFWKENEERVPLSWDITLSDFSAGMLQDARQILREIPLHFSYQVIDAQSIPFPDHSFDCVIANFMLYHVPERARALSEIRRVLKPEGCLYAATVGTSHLHEIGEFVHRVNEEFDAKTNNPFTLESGEREIAQYFSHVECLRMKDGLEVTEIEPLLAYILSGKAKKAISDEMSLRRLRALLEQELAQRGTIYLTKDSGLFKAHGLK